MSSLTSIAILFVFMLNNFTTPAFPIHGNQGLTKLEYVAVEIYKAKLIEGQQINDTDALITEAISEAKKLLMECNKR